MRLILISLDAVSQTDVDRLYSLPTLSMLRQAGVFCSNMTTVYPTLTYPIHTTLLTGCFPDRHGIGHNQPFQPDTPPQMRRWHWEIGDIRVPTLHQAAREAGGRVASVLWPVTGKNPYVRYCFPEVLPLPGENAVLKMLRYASPLWILEMEARYGRLRRGARQPYLDDFAVRIVQHLLSARRAPDLTTLHLVDLDAMRHQYGTESDEAHAAMARLDKRLGDIVHTLKETRRWDDTLLCVVSDHGHRDAPRGVFLDAMLEKAGVGRAQSLGMGAFIFSDCPERALAALEENRTRWHIGHIYQNEELRALHAAPEVTLAVDAEDGCCFIDEAEITHGEHGFSPDYPQARATALFVGSVFASGATLSAARAVDIAPTLAQAMGWRLPDTDGRPLDVFR